MRRMAACIAFLALAGCAQSPAPEPFPQDALDQWIARYTANDAEGVAALYAEDAQLLPPDAPIVNGRAAIREFIARTNPPGGPKLEFATVEALVFGAWAHRQGSFRVIGPDGSTAGTGKVMELWKKTGGKWQIYRDMWSWDTPSSSPDQAPRNEPP